MNLLQVIIDCGAKATKYTIIREYRWEKSADAKLIKITSISSTERKVFTAGGNVKGIVELLPKKDPSAVNELISITVKFGEILQFIGTMSTPVIAIMDGITMGVGSGLSGQLPFRIATENTVYAMPETATIGSFMDASTSFTLSRYDNNLGLYIGLTGNRIYAEDVLFCELASHFVHSSNLEAMNEKLSQLKSPTHDSINSIIEEYAVKPNHVPLNYTLFGDKLDIIDSYLHVMCFQYNSVEEIVQALKDDGSKFSANCVKLFFEDLL